MYGFILGYGAGMCQGPRKIPQESGPEAPKRPWLPGGAYATIKCVLYGGGILRYTVPINRGRAAPDTAKQYASLFRQVKTATAQGRPQARVINIMRAEDDGMYIVTSKGKPFYKQLVDTGEIALAAMCPGCQPLKFTGRLHP